MASESISPHRAPRALFFGMHSDISAPSLAALLEAGIDVCAVVIPGSPRPGRTSLAIQRLISQGTRPFLPVLNASLRPSIEQIAEQHQIPVWTVYRLAHPETVTMLTAYQPDVICVACFSRILPPVIIDLPRLGCLNVHPSLLPANRGPVPLFWTFREGPVTTGVTIHMMDAGIDSGDILAQTTVEVLDGMSHDQLEAQCAALGGSLLARTVWNLYNGCARRIPQDEAKSSYHSHPLEEDFIVRAQSWSARHVYNFICGVSATWGPVLVEVGNKRWLVRKATSYSHEIIRTYRDETMEESGELIVPCRDGHVVLALAEDVSEDLS